MEDDEYQKLPVEDRCVHKLWKARVDGYENVTKLFRQIDEKSPEFQKYLGLVKKFVVDSNAMGQEKGLEATLAFVENYAHAGKSVGEVMSGIVTKCMGAPKAKTRELALQVTLMYVEIEKHEIVMEELLKGMEHKNPKLVAACINAATTALREFGSKVVIVKPLVKKISALFSDRDKGVRDEARLMVIEIYRWIGPGLKSQLTNLQPVQLTELEAEFSKVDSQKAVPTRYLRSQQEKQAQIAVEAATNGEEGEAEDEEEAESTALDPYDLADPVEILSKLPGDFMEKIEAKKWTERKEVLETLETLTKNPKLANGDYGDVVRVLRKVVQKDSNVLCASLAAKCLCGLATGLKKRFHPYASACIPVLLEKFKEKKANVVTAVRDAVDAIYLSTTLEPLLEDIIEAFNNKNPSVKSETALFLARAFTKTQPAVLNKKILKTLTTALIKIINESDPTVRDSSAETLGTLKKLVGDKMIMPFLVELEKDNLKMTKINEFCEKAVITVKVAAPKKEKPPPQKVVKPKAADKAPARAPAKKLASKPAIVKSASNDSLDVDDSEESPEPVQDTATRVDITTQITDDMLTELSNSNWKERNEALIKIGNVINGVKAIKPNIGDLQQALVQRLDDSNAKIVQTTLNICEQLAVAMGSGCKQSLKVWFPGFLKALGDSKAFMRSAALNCINTFGKQAGYKEFFEAENIADALKAGTPTLKIELWNWLAEQLPNLKSVPKEELVACIPILYANLEDRNADVRKNAQEAVLGIMIHLGYESMLKQTEKLKPGSKTAVVAALDKARPNLPIKPLPTKKAEPKEEKTVRGTKPVANSKNAVKKPGSANKAAPTSRKKEEETDTSPLLVVNNMKHQRTIDESKLKVLKWNFTTPREEFVELLKELMINAKVNKTLMSHMFHADFRYHIKAIESLMEDLPDNGPALISNLDLILKWFTLRFFDTNPSVLLKSLEYLQMAFEILIQNNYQLLENEAASFIPYLILKIGDPKDAVRNGVKWLCQKIAHVYSVSKLFSFYIMEGLKSKNARQRAECLELMGTIIEEDGIQVCLPSPGACLKEVARQISDRDNSVRTAALNCIVQAYFIVGEKVYKMVGQICDKNMSLLEERIKRAQRKPPPQKVNKPNETINIVSPSPSHQELSPSDRESDQIVDNDEQDDEEEMNNLPDVVLPPQTSVPKVEEVTGPYRLDPELMAKLDAIKIQSHKPKLQQFDLTFLDEEIKVPAFFKDKMKEIPKLPPRPFLPISVPSTRTSQEFIPLTTIQNIASSEATQALQAMNQISQLFSTNKENLVLNEDNFASAISNQFKQLSQKDPNSDPNTYRVYKGLLNLMDTFLKNEANCKKISSNVLMELINDLIFLLADRKLDNLRDGEAIIRVINIQTAKLIERSNHTNIFCALVRLLRECLRESSGVSPKHKELVMKCLWKIIKVIPSWSHDIEYDSVLLEIHLFLKEYPSSWWIKQESDTPMRTIKTILHSMAKQKGGSLPQYYGKIPNTMESEMEAYITKILKTLKIEEVKQVPLKVESGRSLSRSTHTQLTEIFQKIGNKEETEEGMNLLYDFIKEHPEADINPFLNKSSPFFQNYIKKNLEKVEVSRQANVAAKTDTTAGNMQCDKYFEQLEHYKKIFNDKIKDFHN